jgi:hypothetical protein
MPAVEFSVNIALSVPSMGEASPATGTLSPMDDGMARLSFAVDGSGMELEFNPKAMRAALDAIAAFGNSR